MKKLIVILCLAFAITPNTVSAGFGDVLPSYGRYSLCKVGVPRKPVFDERNEIWSARYCKPARFPMAEIRQMIEASNG